MKSVNDIIELNNHYRELLNEDNKIFYEDILVYIRSKSFFKDERQIEESLLEILTDIIDAQNENIQAEDYFGKNSKEISNEILKNTKKSSFKDNLISTLHITYIYALVLLFPELLNSSEVLDLGCFFICLIITLPFIHIILSILGKSVYCINQKKSNFILIILFILYIGIISILDRFLHTPIELRLEGFIGISIILILGITGIIYCFKNEYLKALLPVILIGMTIGIIDRLSFINFSTNENPGKIISGIAMFFSFGLFYLITYFKTKDN